MSAAASAPAPAAVSPASRVPAWVRPAVVGAVLAGLAVVLMVANRGPGFWLDEWDFAGTRADLSADALFTAQNQNIVVLLVLIYKVMLELFGMGDTTALRILSAAIILLLGWLGYRYAAPRLGWPLAVVVMVALVLSPANEVTVWPFQMGYVISACAGVGALLALDRLPRRQGVITAGALLVLATAASSLALPLYVLIAADRLLRPGRRLDAACVLPAVALYGLWWLAYASKQPAPNELSIDSLLTSAGIAIKIAGGTLQAQLGLLDLPRHGPTLGLLAAFALTGGIVARCLLVREGRARVIALALGLMAYWFALAFARGTPGVETSLRHLYGGTFLLVLLLVDVLAPLTRLALAPRVRWAAAAATAAALAAIVVVQVDRTLRFGDYFAAPAETARAQIIGLGISPASQVEKLPFYLDPGVNYIGRSGALIAATLTRFGAPPSGSDRQALALGERGRAQLDAMLAIGYTPFGVFQPPATPPPPAAPAPPVRTTAPGATIRRGPVCALLAGAGGARSPFTVALPRRGVLLVNDGSEPLPVVARRYSATGPVPPFATIPPGGRIGVRFGADGGRRPWRLELAAQRARACGLG